MMLAAWMLLAQVASALVIETGSPDALCPDLSQTRAAVMARLGTLKVSREGWRARYTIGHAPDSAEGDFVRLELRDPDGELKLQRDLPLEAGACATMSQAIALILERYFRSLLPTPGQDQQPIDAEQPTEPSRADEASPVPGPPPAPPARPAQPRALHHAARPADSSSGPSDLTDAVGPRSSSAGRRRLVLLGAGGAYLAPPSAGALLLSVAADLSESFRVGLLGLLPLAQASESVGSATLLLDRWPLRTWVGWVLHAERFCVHLGPEAVVSVEAARAEGLQQGGYPDRAVRAVPGLGLSAGAAIELGAGLGLFTQGGLDVLFPELSREFTLDPDGEPVLVSPWLAGFVGAGLVFSVAP